MIEGTVNAALQAIIRLQLLGPTGRTAYVDAVIVTGFGGFLTLPPDLVAKLDLISGAPAQATLQDGAEVTRETCTATVMWDGRAREVVAQITSGTPAVGMSMLAEHAVHVDVAKEAGRVVIEAIP
ncbi:MAG: clan AA aspartic protease [Chloroflexi bacterium]|nr:clan AA aspartic protease [Chloroflexota bacterium]